MLYFSKLRIISVLLLTLIFSYFTLSNFTKLDDEFFSKNINLGLDLQGGSYLLLEIDNTPVVTQKLQSKVLELKKYFKQKKLIIKNFSVNENSIIFESNPENVAEITNILDDDNGEINPYFQQFKTHQYDFVVNNNFFKLSLSNYGLVLLKSSSLDQINGVGPKKRKALILRFGSTKKVSEASIKELCKTTGINDVLATQIFNFFNGWETNIKW